MRITSAMISRFVNNAHNNAKQATYDPQVKITTGRRIMMPSDDLPAANRILDLDRALEELRGMERVRGMVRSDLEQADSMMGDTADLLTDAHTLAIQMSNDSIGPDERADAATRIQTMIDTIYSYANHQRADGRYLFNGTDDQNPPYGEDAAGNKFFQGTNQNRTVELAPGMNITTTITAAETFENSGVIATLEAFQTALTNNDADGIRAAIDELDGQISDFGNMRGRIGHRLNALDDATDISLDLELQYLSERSDLRDVDLAAEVTNLAMAENTLMAVLETTKRFMAMNLKNFL